MVLVKKRCPPESICATLAIHLTTTHPTLSLSSLKLPTSTPVLEFNIHLRCTSSTQPSRPLTIYTPGTIFDDSHSPEDGHMDNLALGMLGGGLTCTTEHGVKRVSFGYFKVHRARQEGWDAPDLRDRPDAAFLTIPAKETGEEVIVKHSLTSERLFAYADGKTPDDLVVGEKYRVGLSEGYVGTTWWCWGGLAEELQGKKLHAAAREGRGLDAGEELDVKQLEKEGWVFGENRAQLVFGIEEGRGKCEVEIVQ